MIKPDYDPDLFPHWSEIPIRFRDLDPLNHVNNALFNTFFEEARIKFIHTLPEFLESMKRGKSFVLVHLEINYIKPITYPGSILVGSAVKEFGNSSLTGFQAIYDSEDQQLLAVAESTGVWFDVEKQRPVRLPDIPGKDSYILNTD